MHQIRIYERAMVRKRRKTSTIFSLTIHFKLCISESSLARKKMINYNFTDSMKFKLSPGDNEDENELDFIWFGLERQLWWKDFFYCLVILLRRKIYFMNEFFFCLDSGVPMGVKNENQHVLFFNHHFHFRQSACRVPWKRDSCAGRCYLIKC